MFAQPQTFPFRPGAPVIVGEPLVAEFKRAPVDASGIQLSPGRYFIDTSESHWLDALPGLLDLMPRGAIQTQLPSGGRGQIMVSLRLHKAVTVPRSLATLTGFFYVLPEGMSLIQAHDQLYSKASREPRGFWEWLHDEHPTTFKAAQTTAETIDETADAVADAAGKTGTTLIKVAFGALAAWLVIKLIASSSTSNEGDT